MVKVTRPDFPKDLTFLLLLSSSVFLDCTLQISFCVCVYTCVEKNVLTTSNFFANVYLAAFAPNTALTGSDTIIVKKSP